MHSDIDQRAKTKQLFVSDSTSGAEERSINLPLLCHPLHLSSIISSHKLHISKIVEYIITTTAQEGRYKKPKSAKGLNKNQNRKFIQQKKVLVIPRKQDVFACHR